jgi:hypothetical protein
MPYTQPFIQCVIGGNVDAGTETDIWQIGLKVTYTEQFISDELNMNKFVNDLKADALKWWASIGTSYSSRTSLSFVKANVIGTDGFYMNKGQSFRLDFPEQPGSFGQQTLPSEVAFVVTLLTPINRGLASKGRVYLPAPGQGTQNELGLVSDNFATLCRDATAQLIRDVGDVPGIDGPQGIGDVAVMSDVRLGATQKVTGVRTDNLWDTQRRRGNKFRGTRSVTVPI